jgi:D-3-phosphoglycerate dehydrogenase
MKVQITTSSFDLNNFVDKDLLTRANIDIALNPMKSRLTESQVTELLNDDVVGMIAGLEPLNGNVLRSAKTLKVIARCGTGLDSVDLDVARELGIEVYNTPNAPARAVAEFTIGHMLNSLRHISATDHSLREGSWTPTMGSLLGTKKVGLIGFGRIGKMVSELLLAFGASVQAFDPIVSTTNSQVEMCDLQTLLASSDIISLHVPYSPATHHLINAEALSLMKPLAILVNISRGGLIDEDALFNSLTSNRIAGAALDCFEIEPYTGPLRTLPNVCSTSHMGSYARETRDQMEIEASTALVAGLKKHGFI